MQTFSEFCRREFEVAPWVVDEPSSNWYKEYVVSDDIWKIPIGSSEEIAKELREAYYMYKKLQLQQAEDTSSLTFIGEL